MGRHEDWGGAGLQLIAGVVVDVSSDWSKIDDKAMPILGRFACKTWRAGQGSPLRWRALSQTLIDRASTVVVPYIRPKRKGPARGMR